MKNKFTMSLTWHNCYSCPPEEYWNDKLWVTDGKWVFPVEYDREEGRYDKEAGKYLPFELLWNYWWADINRTVRECSEFKKEN